MESSRQYLRSENQSTALDTNSVLETKIGQGYQEDHHLAKIVTVHESADGRSKHVS